MTKKKIRLPLSPEWTAISDYARKSNFIQSEDPKETPNFDVFLNKRIRWFLKYGAVTTLYIIKETFGDKELDLFIDFIREYLEETGEPGSFHESTRLHSQLAFYHNSAQLFDFENYLNNLEKELRRVDIFKEAGFNDNEEIE